MYRPFIQAMIHSNDLLSQIEDHASDLEDVLMNGDPRLRRNMLVRVAGLCSQLKPANSYESEVFESFLAVVRHLHQLAESRPIPRWRESWEANLSLLSHFQNVAIRL